MPRPQLVVVSGTRNRAAACQVVCFGDPEVLARRFLERIERGERHPGHADQPTLSESRGSFGTGRGERLCLDGPVIELDTTDFSILDMRPLGRTISELLPSPVAVEAAT
jgi:hypothetical protein